jgi:DNA-binding transcriptional LysR family regulator
VTDLDLRLLRYFVDVVDHGGFTAAASTLHVSQPALSQAVQRLEAVVGAKLVERGPRGSKGLTLTGAGRVLYPEAVELLQRGERAIARTRSSVETVSLRLGFGTNTPRQLTRRAMEAAERLASVEMALQHVMWGEEQHELLCGAVDLMYIQVPAGFAHPELWLVPLRTVRRVGVFRRDHRLAVRATIELAELCDEPIIDAATDRDFWLANPRPGYPLPKVVGPAATTVEEMLALVSAGLGMAITSESVADKHGNRDLAFVPITDLEPAVIALAQLRDDTRPGLAELVRLISAGPPDAGDSSPARPDATVSSAEDAGRGS